MRRALWGLATLALAAAGATAAPGDTPAAGRFGPAFPQFASPEALAAACDGHLVAARSQLKQLERRRVDSGWLSAYDRYSAGLEDRFYPLLFLSAVHPDPALRGAAAACALRFNDFNSTLSQNGSLYRAIKQSRPADESDRLLRRQLLEGFEDSGVALPPAARARAKQLSDQTAELGQTFDRHIRDANVKLGFTVDELKGVPEAVWADAPRDADGRVVLGVDYPRFNPVMQSADSAAARERMWRAKINEGGAANLQLLAQIARLRQETAALYGLPSYADFVIRRRMAGSPARVQAFLGEVKSAVQAREHHELDELRQAKATHLNQPLADTQLQRWDTAYYTERLRRERYAVDQEAMRVHFPPEESLAFTLKLVERLMGVRYQRVPGAPAWHPEVHTYAVSDAATGQPLATLWVDLYPREGKYNHAAVWPLRSGSTAMKRLPQAALVVNVDRKGLTLDELETLLHELGHAVHNNLAATRRSLQAGTAVKLDFVEAPSQMLEDWVYDARTLERFAEVCPRCTPVPGALLAQAVAARHYGKGVAASRQHLYASYDLALYGTGQPDPGALWSQMEGDTPLGHVKGSMFPAGFSHIAGGYSAGYYGYLWSLVIAMDLRTAFAADKLDPAVGQRYRRTVLAQGSQREPQQLVREFLGRDFNAQAFFADLQR